MGAGALWSESGKVLAVLAGVLSLGDKNKAQAEKPDVYPIPVPHRAAGAPVRRVRGGGGVPVYPSDHRAGAHFTRGGVRAEGIGYEL